MISCVGHASHDFRMLCYDFYRVMISSSINRHSPFYTKSNLSIYIRMNQECFFANFDFLDTLCLSLFPCIRQYQRIDHSLSAMLINDIATKLIAIFLGRGPLWQYRLQVYDIPYITYRISCQIMKPSNSVDVANIILLVKYVGKKFSLSVWNHFLK